MAPSLAKMSSRPLYRVPRGRTGCPAGLFPFMGIAVASRCSASRGLLGRSREYRERTNRFGSSERRALYSSPRELTGCGAVSDSGTLRLMPMSESGSPFGIADDVFERTSENVPRRLQQQRRPFRGPAATPDGAEQVDNKLSTLLLTGI